MSVQFPTIANGQSVSSAFAIDRDVEFVHVMVPSHAALGWRIEWALATTGPFVPAADPATGAGSGNLYQGFSGTHGAFFAARVMTQIGRIRTSGNASAVCTPAVIPYFGR